MLNTFPELLSYSLLSPFILRVIVGFIFLKFGFVLFQNKKPNTHKSLFLTQSTGFFVKLLGTFHIIAGLFLIIGLYTQMSSIFVFISSLVSFVATKYKVATEQKQVFYILLMAISISLTFSGAGAFALDMPL